MKMRVVKVIAVLKRSSNGVSIAFYKATLLWLRFFTAPTIWSTENLLFPDASFVDKPPTKSSDFCSLASIWKLFAIRYKYTFVINQGHIFEDYWINF